MFSNSAAKKRPCPGVWRAAAEAAWSSTDAAVSGRGDVLGRGARGPGAAITAAEIATAATAAAAVTGPQNLRRNRGPRAASRRPDALIHEAQNCRLSIASR